MQVFKSLYIHIPFCLSKCAYCDFFSKPVLSVPDSYVEALCNELSFRLDNDDTNIETVYIGGGTPSLLTEHQITQIFSKIYFYVKRENIKECTFEINPDDVTEKLLEVLYSFGVTRLSMGVQSFDNKVLSFCKRRADRKQIERAFSIIEKNWEGELSIDLIS